MYNVTDACKIVPSRQNHVLNIQNGVDACKILHMPAKCYFCMYLGCNPSVVYAKLYLEYANYCLSMQNITNTCTMGLMYAKKVS